MTTQTVSHWSADNPDRYQNSPNGDCPACGFALAQDDAGDTSPEARRACPDCGEALEVIQARLRIAGLEAALERFIAVGQAVIDRPCEVNWTALQANIANARLLLADPRPAGPQLSLFDRVLATGMFHAAYGFVSNGYVAVRLGQCEIPSEGMAALVDALADMSSLVPARPIVELPESGDLPALVVFEPEGAPPLVGDPGPALAPIPVNRDLLELAMGARYLDDLTAAYFSFRCHRHPNRAGEMVPIIAIYDYYGSLAGFVASVCIGDDNEVAFRAALVQALETPEVAHG